MMLEGKIWPTSQEHEPQVARFHVPRSPILASQEEFVAGTTCIVITETGEQVHKRLVQQYPAYRIATWGQRLLGVASEV